MIRNLKAMGLALVAVFALSAVVASAASAQGKLTTEGGQAVTLTGTETGVKANALTAFGIPVECPGSSYTGHKDNVTPHTFIPNLATSATITPHYATNCLALNTYPATVTKNGCDFVIRVGATTGEQTATKKTFAATFDVVCPAGKSIEVEVWEHAQAHTNVPWCTVKVGSQVGLVGAHVTSTPASDDLDLDGTVEGIKASRSGTKAILCPTSETSAAKFDLDVTVKAHNSLGNPVGITVTD